MTEEAVILLISTREYCLFLALIEKLKKLASRPPLLGIVLIY